MATEERLIYASEVLWRLRMLKESKIDDPFFGGKRNTIWDLALNSAISRVEDCPTVDAVEVVRCRECKKEWCYMRQELGADGFCSAGERKGNG